MASRALVIILFAALAAAAWVRPAWAGEPPPARPPLDRPDDSPEYQIHVVYAVPSDGVDERLDLNGTIAASVEEFQSWFEAQTGGLRLRVDTHEGVPDVSFLRLAASESQLDVENVLPYLQNELLANGIARPNKVYAVYYQGGAPGGLCGAGGPPIAMVYSNQRCGPLAMLHELLHALGFVFFDCAPHRDAESGHVTDDPDDLLSRVGRVGQRYVLDAGRDDYFDHGIEGCPDLKDSAFIEPLPAAAEVFFPLWPDLGPPPPVAALPPASPPEAPPCPPGGECVTLAPGCQIVSLIPFEPGTEAAVATSGVEPPQSAPRLWFYSARDGAFVLFDPASAERSGRSALSADEEAAFLCVETPATWELPDGPGARREPFAADVKLRRGAPAYIIDVTPAFQGVGGR